ncbi:50S ribosomal protein L32, partial [Jeotgalibacillus sp. ET6]|uniref:50S ribosomal protein L32 n=1 Tax=Jeotgalibacillus sp. ET6 TaxID=3037260 RepID=UPI003FA5283B
RSRKGMRRSHDVLTPVNVVYCSCGAPTRSHAVCPTCGKYKERQVIHTATSHA